MVKIGLILNLAIKIHNYMKYLAALSTIAMFLTAGWVIITGDGIRWFFLSVLCLVAGLTGMILMAVRKEMARRESGAVIERSKNEVTKKNLN